MMYKSLTVLFSAFFLIPGICFSQVDASASKVADKYLSALKIIDLPEGRAMLSEAEWEKPVYNEYPVFMEASTLFESMFATTIPGIQGYKRLVLLKTISKAKTPLIERYLLICYRDKRSQKWKVLDFTVSIDLEYWIRETKNKLSGKHILPAQYNYREYGFFLLAAGKIDQAKEAFQKACDLNRENPDPRSDQSQNDFDVFLEIIGNIVGK